MTGKQIPLRTQMEMARGRGAVELAHYMQEVMQKSAELQRMTPHRITTEIVSNRDCHMGREDFEVKLKLVRYEPVPPTGGYVNWPGTLLLEVTESKDVFPSDNLIAKIMLVS
jgi:hypothetical protein